MKANIYSQYQNRNLKVDQSSNSLACECFNTTLLICLKTTTFLVHFKLLTIHQEPLLSRRTLRNIETDVFQSSIQKILHQLSINYPLAAFRTHFSYLKFDSKAQEEGNRNERRYFFI